VAQTLIERGIGGIGQFAVDALAAFGNFWAFAARTLAWSPAALARRRDLGRLLPQFFAIGVESVPVILITGLFVGMVLAVQSIEQFQAAGLTERMGVIVSLSVALTAELGTMNVTEQIDALRSMGSDPIRVLTVPRFLACLVLTPVLTLYCDVMGVYGGWLICVPIFNVPKHDFWSFTEAAVGTWDVFSGLFKSVFFGATIGLISTYKGFHCRQGAQGVGQACTEAFVASFIVILVLDFFISLFLKEVYEAIWGFKAVF
jgi:phospholipid/cholesterol/gamma-HCH transport system permease protein